MSPLLECPKSGSAAVPLPLMAMGNQRPRPNRSASQTRPFSFEKTNGSNYRHHHAKHVQLELRRDALNGSNRQPPRVALYSHDTMGLGHLRRNLLISQALSESPLQATSLLITGAHEANFFSPPPGADFLTLPRLRKSLDGNYTTGQLAISIEDLICMRADSITSALVTFQPDVFIVDKVPSGAFGELLPTLRFLKEQTKSQCVLGIRDILDAPETVRSEWKESQSQEIIEEYFDEIWVYGDQQVYDVAQQYGWDEQLQRKLRYTGYLNQARQLHSPNEHDAPLVDLPGHTDERLVVCTLGGGQDGYSVGEAFLDAVPEQDYHGVLLTGPFMENDLFESLRQAAAARSNITVRKFTPHCSQLLSRADSIIAMGGYNTVCSVLSFQKRALIVPRVFPRTEQWIRAKRLEELGLLDAMHPEELSSQSLRQWIERNPSPRPDVANTIDLAGLSRIQQLCRELVGKHAESNSSQQKEKV